MAKENHSGIMQLALEKQVHPLWASPVPSARLKSMGEVEAPLSANLQSRCYRQDRLITGKSMASVFLCIDVFDEGIQPTMLDLREVTEFNSTTP